MRVPDGGFEYPPAPFTTFLVTNHTGKTVVASLLAIQVKDGSNWITQMRPHGPLNFAVSAAYPKPGSRNPIIPGLTTTELKPHQDAYARIQFSATSTPSDPAPKSWVPLGMMNYLSAAPTGAVWRLVVSVQSLLTGHAEAVARIKRYPEMQSRLAAMQVTNAQIEFFSKPIRVVSQEVSTE